MYNGYNRILTMYCSNVGSGEVRLPLHTPLPPKVFQEEKIMQSAAEAMRQMRNIEKGAELSSQLAQKVRLRGTTGYHGCSECLSRATNKRPGG